MGLWENLISLERYGNFYVRQDSLISAFEFDHNYEVLFLLNNKQIFLNVWVFEFSDWSIEGEFKQFHQFASLVFVDIIQIRALTQIG